MVYYFNNYDELCYNQGYSEKIKKILPLTITPKIDEIPKKFPYWIIILILLIGFVCILVYFQKKKGFVILLLNRFKEKLK